MKKLTASTNIAAGKTTRSDLLILTAAVEWTIFFTTLAFSRHSGMSVLQWFALVALFCGALISLTAGYLIHQADGDLRGVHLLFRSGMLIWATAGFFWPDLARDFSSLTITAYLFLALLLSPQTARPYALLVILSLWAVAADSLIAAVPLSLLLGMAIFLAEIVYAPLQAGAQALAARLEASQENQNRLTRTLTRLQEEQIALNRELEARETAAGDWESRIDHMEQALAVVAGQANWNNTLQALAAEGQKLLQAEATLLFQGESGDFGSALPVAAAGLTPDELVAAAVAFRNDFPSGHPLAVGTFGDLRLLGFPLALGESTPGFFCLTRRINAAPWSRSDEGIGRLFLAAARGHLRAREKEDALDRWIRDGQQIDNATKALFRSLDAEAIARTTAAKLGQTLGSRRVRIRLFDPRQPSAHD